MILSKEWFGIMVLFLVFMTDRVLIYHFLWSIFGNLERERGNFGIGFRSTSKKRVDV